MKLDTLAQKTGLGFLMMVVLLTIAVLATLAEVRELQETSEQFITVDEPITTAVQELETGLNHSVAALRGWIITQDDSFRQERILSWAQEINGPLNRLQQLSLSLAGASTDDLNAIAPLLLTLDDYQQRAEELAVTDPVGASVIVQTEGAPLVLRIQESLERMNSSQREISAASFAGIQDRIVFLTRLQWTLLIVGLGSGVLLTFAMARSVAHPVAQAVRVAENIGGGDLDVEVSLSGARELVVLGTALARMRDSLKRFRWLGIGQNRLGEILRGDQGIEELCTNVVTFMATYTGTNVAALYLLDETRNTLTLTGTYAFGADRVQNRFDIGEGLVGQAAREQKALSLTDVDVQHLRIRSSFVETTPRYMYVCPFTFEGNTLGVMEFGKFIAFTAVELEFIQGSMEAVGIALNSAIARMKIRQLLEETQQQSEELQQQQEELEQSNEELEEQGQKLKEQQEELHASNEELEEQTQIVMQKNRDLEAARAAIELKAKQLEVGSKYKSEFLANMSHELRTPLNSLLILAKDLADNNNGNLDAEQVESAQVISKSGHDLLNLINDILDLSKVEAGKLDLNFTNIRIQDFADGLLRNFRRMAQEKGLVLKCSIDPALPETLRSDRNRLEQIVNNLVSNALKFTDQGEVAISISPAPGEYLSIAVSDTGIGITRDKHDAVFEAFVQAEGGTSRKYGGTGLGLAISRELAGLLGGKIVLQSEPGHGSTFTLTLPLQHGPARKAPEPPRPTPKYTAPVEANLERFLNQPAIEDSRNDIHADDRVVLIVDDDHDFARILAAQARDKGFKYLHAATGEDGLRLAREFSPHAILLDLDLPGIDGHHVLKELKGDPDLRHIPVHIISVNEKTLDPIRSGAVNYLTKPVTKVQLEAAFARIEDFIDRKMKNLLIVEDDAAMRKAIRKLIGNGDVQCHEAGSAAEALQLFQQQNIDCIVLDVGLPDISGFELLRQFEKICEEMPPVIVYTGKELTRQENDELQQYAETIIVKGVKSEERLLDETALFLHRTVRNLPKPKREMITQLYDKAGLLRDKKVLLVDDDMRNVFALGKVLKERGMEVLKAENGLRALELLESNSDIAIVLMDIMMPEMDGYECTRRIRKDMKFRDLPIVCLTAKAMKDDRQKCIDAGANDYISKPVDVERLVSLMRIWIRK